MKRHIALLTAGLGLSAATMSMAPAAHATDITNPADNPAPITVKVDGQSYTDGQDTLPGYDDYACTIIPGISYDYANNQVIYHTDSGTKTVHWTEWDRIAGYQVWLKQQSSSSGSSGGSSSGSGSSSSTGGTSSSSSTTKSSSSTKSSTKTTTKSSTKTTKATAKPTATAKPSASATADPSASATETASEEPSASASAKPHHHKKNTDATSEAAVPVAEATPSTDTTVADDQQLASADAADHGAGNTHVAGLLVLGAFAVGSVALFAGNAVRNAVGRRRRGDIA